MDSTEALRLLKLDLGITHTKRDELLLREIAASEKMLCDRGVLIDPTSDEDMMLLVMHSAFLHERKKDGNIAMPQPLALLIRNRQANAVLKVSDSDTEVNDDI